MTIRNTGQIIGMHVCEFTGDVVISRKRTMRDVSLEMERVAVAKKAAAKALAGADAASHMVLR